MKIKEKIYAFIKLQRLSLRTPLKASYKVSFEYPDKKVSAKKEESLYDVESFLSLK
jgi:hypothetical protein